MLLLTEVLILNMCLSADKFNWDKKTWTVDYLECFEKFKAALNDSHQAHIKY